MNISVGADVPIGPYDALPRYSRADGDIGPYDALPRYSRADGDIGPYITLIEGMLLP